MSSIVINLKDKSKFDFISKLLKKLGVKSNELSEEEMEDIGLGIIMKEVKCWETVSDSEILKKLNGKLNLSF
ncbi:hypothetical protein HZR84_06150 [Hyphobacterium sp. CCMP332]|nr:hypothetical protein HZR84_06150 [Hyphobacterium sp. CCMP332]